MQNDIFKEKLLQTIDNYLQLLYIGNSAQRRMFMIFKFPKK